MSQYIGEAYVKIIPDSRGFAQQVDKEVTAATRQAGSKSRPRDALLAQAAEIKATVAASRQWTAEQNLSNAATQRTTRSLGQGTAAFGAIGAAAFVGYQALQQASAALRVTGSEAGSTEGRIRNLGASLLQGDIIGGLKALTVQATLSAQALANLQGEIDRGDYSNLNKLAAGAKALGASGLSKQIQAVQLQSALNFQAAPFRNTATGAVASTPGGSRPDDRGGLQGVGAASQINTDALIGVRQARRASNLANAALRAELTKGLQDDLRIAKEQEKAARTRVTNAAAGSDEEKASLEALTSAHNTTKGLQDQILASQKKHNDDRKAQLQKEIQLAQTGLAIELASARTDQQQVAALQDQAAFSRRTAQRKGLDAQSRANFALEAAQADKQIFDINQAAAAEAKRAAEERARQIEQERKEALEKLRQRREEAKQLRELSIENGIAAAGLTKSTADDKKRINIQINYFRNLVKNTKGLEREQARSSLISARSRLQGLSANEAPGATAGSFFDEAASQFRTYGSNISGSRNGVLSGQDARARFAQIAMANRGSIGTSINGGLQSVSAAVNAAATEAVIHTQLLKGILNAVAGSKIQSGLKAVQAGVIQNARKHALNNGGGI